MGLILIAQIILYALYATGNIYIMVACRFFIGATARALDTNSLWLIISTSTEEHKKYWHPIKVVNGCVFISIVLLVSIFDKGDTAYWRCVAMIPCFLCIIIFFLVRILGRKLNDPGFYYIKYGEDGLREILNQVYSTKLTESKI
jgi:hypothetical protein